MTYTAQDIQTYQAEVFMDPAGWVSRALNRTFWPRQAEILTAVRDNQFVAVRSGHGVGKSLAAAALTIWYLESHYMGRVITTASSWKGVERILWPEIHKLFYGASVNLGGTMLETSWMRSKGWDAFSLSPDRIENLQGYHAPGGMLVIVDEASALSTEDLDALMSLMLTDDCRLLLVGNPLRPSGAFFDSFHSPLFKCLRISSLESPNYRFGRNTIPGLVTRTWVEDRRSEWGENDPRFLSRVLGEFPESAEDALFSISDLDAALKAGRNLPPAAKLYMGVDIARYGKDRTVFAIRDANALRHLITINHNSTMDSAGRVIALAKEYNISPRNVSVDDVGVGGGVVDRLHELGFQCQAVIAGARAQSEYFQNVRTELYFRLAEEIRNGFAIAPEAAGIKTELQAIHRDGYTSRGQQRIESKEAMRKRLKRSPDLSDALALSFFENKTPEPTAIWVD